MFGSCLWHFNYVTLSKFYLTSPGLRIHINQKGDENNTCVTGLLWGFSALMHMWGPGTCCIFRKSEPLTPAFGSCPPYFPGPTPLHMSAPVLTLWVPPLAAHILPWTPPRPGIRQQASHASKKAEPSGIWLYTYHSLGCILSKLESKVFDNLMYMEVF